MIALMSFVPKACPNCGDEWPHLRNDPLCRQDFLAGASHTCRECGLHFAYADGRKILALAAEEGDIGRYVDETNLDPRAV